MIKTCPRLAVAAAIAGCLSLNTAEVSAGPMRLDATSTDSPRYSDFSILFNDTGDGRFDLDEMTWFSGMTGMPFTVVRDFTVILSAPGVADVSDHTPSSGYGVGFWALDVAGGGFGHGFNANSWTYVVTDVDDGRVPEPSTLAITGLALGALAFARRRRA